MADRIGQQLGNYRLTRLLGRGGFAEVYLGEHIYLKSQAALKVLRTSLSDKDVQRFLTEAQTLVRLRHPHIVRVLEFAVEQGTPVLVMDYAPGGIIRETYSPGSPLPLKVVVTYIKQMASALQYAHNHNVIHRDVKPENILLGPEQELLLSDFGLSLLTASPDLLSTQEMAGTIPYMAPEQLHGKPVFASDQYALGIVTYEWLCGSRPFTGTLWEIAHQHMSAAPPPLREKCPTLPVEVEDVVLKALAKEPQQRFVSVQAFAHALARASQVSMLEESAQASSVVSKRSEASFATQPDQSLRRIFLAASPADEDFAIILKADLEARGTLVDSTPNTPDQEDEVRQAIRAAQFVLVVISPHMRSSRTIKEYLRIASMYERQLVFVQAAGDDIATMLPEGWGKTAVIDLIDAREGRYELALDELVACLEAEKELSITAPLEPFLSEAGGKLPEPRNPYKGLRAFTQDDATDFFGRDTLIQELVDTMQSMLVPAISAQPGTAGARLLTIIGPSGSGKSSVVMAGLLPRLQNGTLPGSEEWVYLDTIVPGQHPMEALTLALSSHFPARSLTMIREDLQDDATRGLHLLAASLAQKPETKVVLMVDQLEELFTQTTSEEERQRFIDLLVTAVKEACGPLIVILTLRADFYDRLAQYPELGRLIQKHHQMVFHMEIQDLRAIIEQPAALSDVQLTFEGNLVGDLLFETQGQMGALPLLEFTLDQLFEQRKDHQLTLDAYQKIGGVKGALAKHAEATYASLPSEDHRRLARALFLRLIDPGVTEQDTTRRRAALSELSLPDAKQTTIIKEATDTFIAARLLITNEIAGTTTVEVSHEAVIREWKRLADWLAEAREDIHLQRVISEDVAEWERRGKPKDRLYRGSQLKEARTWAGHNIPSKNEVAFLLASTTRRRRFVVNITAFSLVLVLTMGLAVQLFITRPSIPDPTHVTTLNDTGPGSLRQAIVAAKSGSTITFDASLKGKTILLHDTLDITKDLTIDGPGASNLSISSDIPPAVKVFQGNSVTIIGLTFTSKIIASNASSSIEALTIVNAGTLILTNSIISHSVYGGIYNSGTLTLRKSAISNNRVFGSGSFGGSGSGGRFTFTSSGGIINGGTLTITNSTISDNLGDGIQNAGTLTITNSVISGNRASNNGGGGSTGGPYITSSTGGISNFGTLTITNSTISGNTAVSTTDYINRGGPNSPNALIIGSGGITNNNRGTLTITNSIISGNAASTTYSTTGSSNSSVKLFVTNGGGIANYGGALTITDSTVSGNRTSTSSGFNGITYSNSGGISNYGGKANITFCTIYDNTTQGVGSGIFNGNGEDDGGNQIVGRVQMRNSIVAGNHANSIPYISGTLTTYGYNLIQNFSGIKFDDPNNMHSTDILGDQFPNLGIDSMLRNNGGPTQTLALLPGSPAIDQIPQDQCAVMTDQRGVKRPQGSKCDIGAYEYQPS